MTYVIVLALRDTEKPISCLPPSANIPVGRLPRKYVLGGGG
jgi:hypothetical protein